MKAGESLDGIGGPSVHGFIDNTATARAMAALPIGLSEGCVLRLETSKDAVLSFKDIATPEACLVDKVKRARP